MPSAGRPATDLVEVIRCGGTIYLLGREDPYASPLMTAVAEHVLDTALTLANTSPWGRLCPPLLACLDELPSTAPLPTLQTRMANERAGHFVHLRSPDLAAAGSDLRQHQPRALVGLTNVLVMFGGSKDGAFNHEISDLVGQVRVTRPTWQTGTMAGRTFSGEDIAILRPEEIGDSRSARRLFSPRTANPSSPAWRAASTAKPDGGSLPSSGSHAPC